MHARRERGIRGPCRGSVALERDSTSVGYDVCMTMFYRCSSINTSIMISTGLWGRSSGWPFFSDQRSNCLGI